MPSRNYRQGASINYTRTLLTDFTPLLSLSGCISERNVGILELFRDLSGIEKKILKFLPGRESYRRSASTIIRIQIIWASVVLESLIMKRFILKSNSLPTVSPVLSSLSFSRTFLLYPNSLKSSQVRKSNRNQVIAFYARKRSRWEGGSNRHKF